MANAIPVTKKAPKAEEILQPAAPNGEVVAGVNTADGIVPPDNYLAVGRLANDGDLGAVKAEGEAEFKLPTPEGVPVLTHRAYRVDH